MPACAASERATVLEALFGDYVGTPFRIRLWDEWSWAATKGSDPRCTIVFNSPDSLKTLLGHPSEITLGEAFLRGDIDIEGDIFAAFDMAEYVFRLPKGRRKKVSEIFARLIMSMINRFCKGAAHSIGRDQSAIAYHYDLPVQFFRPWLGESLVYSCAYFQAATDALDVAQEQKLEMICRKLRLQRDDRFLDVGCGWGSLILHAASKHNVYAQGITISQQQANVAEARISAANMTQSCQAALLDYRLGPSHFAPFDKIASLGMFEHVGVKHLNQYFRVIRNMLKPGGVFLNHGIARAPLGGETTDAGSTGWIRNHLLNLPLVRQASSSSFIDKYVFPDGELSTISEAITAAEAAGFEVRDVENLREHYELTLRAWVDNLQRSRRQIEETFSEMTYRTWLLYMAGSAAAFNRGEIAIYQTLLYKTNGMQAKLPLTRADWYMPEICTGRAPH